MSPRLQHQHLLLMKGFPATGKSLLAHGLSRALGWPLVDKDDVKDHLLHLQEANSLAYDIMWSVTRRQLMLGLSVIVDSPLTYPLAFQTGSALAAEYGAHLLVVETQLDEVLWRERLDSRDPAESAHKIAGWEAMQGLLLQYDGCWQYDIPAQKHLVVDATLPVPVLTRAVADRLLLAERLADCPPSVVATGEEGLKT